MQNRIPHTALILQLPGTEFLYKIFIHQSVTENEKIYII